MANPLKGSIDASQAPYYTPPSEKNLISNKLSTPELLDMIFQHLALQDMYSTIRVCRRWRNETLAHVIHERISYINILSRFLKNEDEKSYDDVIVKVTQVKDQSAVWRCTSLNTLEAPTLQLRTGIIKVLAELSEDDLESLFDAPKNEEEEILNWMFGLAKYYKKYEAAVKENDSPQKTQELLSISDVFLKNSYLDGAILAACAIPEEMPRHRALTKLLKLFAECHLYDQIFHMLSTIPLKGKVIDALIYEAVAAICEKDASTINFDKTLQIADLISDKQAKETSFFSKSYAPIAGRLALAKKFDQACAIVKVIPEEHFRETALQDITFMLANEKQYERAENLAKTLPEGKTFLALTEIDNIRRRHFQTATSNP